jgi:hypothetical protein
MLYEKVEYATRLVDVDFEHLPAYNQHPSVPHCSLPRDVDELAF